MNYVIRNIPKEQAYRVLHTLGGRLRGRGYRYGNVRYHQSLPARLAERFSLYSGATPTTFCDFVAVENNHDTRSYKIRIKVRATV